MTVQQLIAFLANSPLQMEVLLRDDETGQLYPISEIKTEMWNGGLDRRIPPREVLVLA